MFLKLNRYFEICECFDNTILYITTFTIFTFERFLWLQHQITLKSKADSLYCQSSWLYLCIDKKMFMLLSLFILRTWRMYLYKCTFSWGNIFVLHNKLNISPHFARNCFIELKIIYCAFSWPLLSSNDLLKSTCLFNIWMSC